MPADRDVVHVRQEPVGEDVYQRVQDQDEGEQEPGLPEEVLAIAEVDPEDVKLVEAQRNVEEEGCAVADTGDDPDRADDVEPAGHPAPARTAEVVRPTSRAARGRIGGGELGHREGHHQDQGAQDRPSERDQRRTAVQPREAEVGEAPGENRDDRERDREVGEPAPAAVQLLLVAELGESFLVAPGLVDVRNALWW